VARRKAYVFEHYVLVRRSLDCPTLWLWEIRRKSSPDHRSLLDGGFSSARAAERAGNKALELVRQADAEGDGAKLKAVAVRTQKVKPVPSTRKQRSENARKAALARAAKLTAQRRAEISRLRLGRGRMHEKIGSVSSRSTYVDQGL
jgi:hypothetical protein